MEIDDELASVFDLRYLAVKEDRTIKCEQDLLHVKHDPEIRPEEWARFIVLRPFAKAWKKLRLTEEDRNALDVLIMARADAPIIPGTGGLRKLRFVGRHWDRGKSGGLRVCYAYFGEFSTVVLVTLYDKKKKSDLSMEEKKAIKGVLREIEGMLRKGDISV